MKCEELAADIGMSRGGLSKFENGYSGLHVERLLDIAHFLQCDAWELIKEAERQHCHLAKETGKS